jgi:subtilisin family serine protease
MKPRRGPLYFALALFLSAPTYGQSQRYLLEADASSVPAVTAKYRLKVVRTIGLKPTYLVEAAAGTDPAGLVRQVSSEQGVKEFEPDTESRIPEAAPAGTYRLSAAEVQGLAQDRRTAGFFGSTVRSIYLDQTASTLIQRPAAQQQFGTGAGVIAVIDTGVDPLHPALQGSLVPGYDFTRNMPGYAPEWFDLSYADASALVMSTVAILDHKTAPYVLSPTATAILEMSTVAILDGGLPGAFGHGTMVAGLIHLIAPTAKIMPLKAFRADGGANVSDIVRAIYYAVDHGAQVINMSFSLDAPQQDLADAIKYAVSKKVVCVASAGNTGKRVIVYPAGWKNVIGVGATDRNDRRCGFSNYGTSCSRTAAPGETLVTLYPGNNYAVVSGTSFSAALVSGAVSLFQGVRPGMEMGKLLDALDKGKEVEAGMGDARLDLWRSLTYLLHP